MLLPSSTAWTVGMLHTILRCNALSHAYIFRVLRLRYHHVLSVSAGAQVQLVPRACFR
jgi:hypothetical protein